MGLINSANYCVNIFFYCWTNSTKLKNKKLDLWVGPWSLTPSYNLNLETLDWCNSEPMKKSKSSRSQLFFELNRIKNLAIFTGKNLWSGLFLIKLQTFRPAAFLKQDSNTGVSCGYCEIFKNSFLEKTFFGCFWQSYHSTVKSVNFTPSRACELD